MQTTKLRIEGMTCANCVRHVQKALERIPGVGSSTVVLGEVAVVHHDRVAAEALKRAVSAAGEYCAEVAD